MSATAAGKGKKQEGLCEVKVYTVNTPHGAPGTRVYKEALAWAGGDASRITEETRTFHPYDYLGMMSQKPTDEIVRTEKSEGNK